MRRNFGVVLKVDEGAVSVLDKLVVEIELAKRLERELEDLMHLRVSLDNLQSDGRHDANLLSSPSTAVPSLLLSASKHSSSLYSQVTASVYLRAAISLKLRRGTRATAPLAK